MTQQRPRARRKPRFAAFLLTGGLAGLVISFFVSLAGPVAPRYDPSAALGLFALMFAGLGALLGGLIAVLVDRRQ